MRAPSRTRRIAKWAGLVVCVVILATWAVSTVATVAYLAPRWQAGLVGGMVKAWWTRSSMEELPPLWIAEFTEFDHGVALPGVRNLPRDHVSVVVPFWMLLAGVAIPTALLWHRDGRRDRRRPGHCQRCGYDLRGSKKVCPECGTAIPARPPKD